MRRALRVVVYAMAAVIVGGTVASAVPGVRPSPTGVPSPSLAPTPAPSPSIVPSSGPSPVPSESDEPSASPEPSETATPGPKDDGRGGGVAPDSNEKDGGATSTGGPDFSACAGLTGLQNAICRHKVLAQLHPKNPGLANSLHHLEGKGHPSAQGPGNAHGGGTD